MGDLLKKLDEIMTSDLVRKLGGLFCLVTVIIAIAAFIIGAGSLLKSIKGPIADVEVTEEEGAEEEGEEGEATDEEAEEEAEEGEATDEEAEDEAEEEEATDEDLEEEAEDEAEEEVEE